MTATSYAEVLGLASMADVAYRSRVRIERVKGPLRRAYLPAEPEVVLFGVHGAVAAHYEVPPEVLEPHATRLDYIAAAAAGGLTGTFGGALEARQVDPRPGPAVLGDRGRGGRCPVYRTLKPAIEITTELLFEAVG
jgi:hypothetical protein